MKMGITCAEIAQLVEHNLAKVGVASSSLVFRSSFRHSFFHSILCIRGREVSDTFFCIIQLVYKNELRS